MPNITSKKILQCLDATPTASPIGRQDAAGVTTEGMGEVASPRLAVEPAAQAAGEWKMTVEEFSFAGCHYNSSCD